MQRNNENGNGRIRVVITAGIAVAGIAAAVCLLKLLVPEKDGDAGQADARQEIVVVEIGEENEGEEWKAEDMEDGRAETDGKGEEIESGSGIGDGTGKKEGDNHTGMPMAAEIAGMDDAEAPQEAEGMNGDRAGAQADIHAVLKGADETGEVSYGVDVAKWQGKIDWQQAADAGVEFAMIRIGYRTQKTGIIMEDPLAKYNMQQAKEAGIKLGVYFFYTAVTQEEAREEAAWVCGFIAQYPITYPVAYNCEGFQSPESRQYGMGQALRSDCAAA